jgi:DNA-binding NarL/FixJ family response regulator
MNKIRILIADDHAIVRMGLCTLLDAQEDFEVVGEAGNGEQTVARALKLRPDVVVMDLVMPKRDGVAATAELREKLPTARCLILTSFGTSKELKSALDAGAAGILLKSTANGKLVSAIRKIAAGKPVIADDVGQLIAEEPPIPELSPRQREILESLTRGLSNNEIALQLDISAESVKTHMTKLFEKLGAANRTEAVAIATRKHLLDTRD